MIRTYVKYNTPREHYPVPTSQDIITGYIVRYFVQKKNELYKIIEIDNATYSTYGNSSGIDPKMWKLGSMKWKISGTETEIINANSETLRLLNDMYPGINLRFNNLLELSI